MLVAVFSLFSYSSEPLDSFNGKSLICKRNIGKHTCQELNVCPSQKDYLSKCCIYDAEPRPHLPSEYIGFKFIKKTVSIDRLSEDNPSELSRKIANMDTVEPYKARWCAEYESKSYKKDLIIDDPLSDLLFPYPHEVEVIEEVKECTSTYTLKRDTGWVSHDYYRIIWGDPESWSIHRKETYKKRDRDKSGPSYNCEVEEDLESYEYFLKNILIQEAKRLADIETQRLEKLKNRKL